MMLDPIQWIALFGILITGVFFVTDARKWRQPGSIVTRTQRILRVLLAIVGEALFVMMLIGPYVVRPKDPLMSMLYWSMCLVLGLVAVALALLDMRIAVRQYALLNRQMFRDLRDDPGLPRSGDGPEK